MWSGVYSPSAGKLALLFSNLDSTSHSVAFPSHVGSGSISGSLSILAGQHKVYEFTAAGTSWKRAQSIRSGGLRGRESRRHRRRHDGRRRAGPGWSGRSRGVAIAFGGGAVAPRSAGDTSAGVAAPFSSAAPSASPAGVESVNLSSSVAQSGVIDARPRPPEVTR